jgi:hypothetical protein
MAPIVPDWLINLVITTVLVAVGVFLLQTSAGMLMFFGAALLIVSVIFGVGKIFGDGNSRSRRKPPFSKSSSSLGGRK